VPEDQSQRSERRFENWLRQSVAQTAKQSAQPASALKG